MAETKLVIETEKKVAETKLVMELWFLTESEMGVKLKMQR